MGEPKDHNIFGFIKEFPNDGACKAYLARIKWQDGFRCVKCGHTKGCKKPGHKYHCYNCHHVESATANTLFHKVKFGLQKAFCIVFGMGTSSKGISSVQMGKRFGIRQGTAWSFMRKVKGAMVNGQECPSSEPVHVEEFTIGGKGEQGNQDPVKKALIVVELDREHQMKRVFVRSIEDCLGERSILIFEEHIGTTAHMVLDGDGTVL